MREILIKSWNREKEGGDTDDFYQFPTHFPLLQNKK